MAYWNNIQRGNVIACQTQGYDPTQIIGKEALVSTSDNRCAFASPPDAPEAPTFVPREITVADLQAIPEPGPQGARGYTQKGDPYAGMGKM